MNPLSHVSSRWSRPRWKLFDPASLRFRLVVSVVVIYAIALTAYKMVSHWSIQTVLMMYSENLNADQFRRIAEQLTSLSFIVISAMFVAVLGVIWLLLRPLHQFKHWVKTTSTEVPSGSFNAHSAPREVRVLAEAWNEMLRQRAAVRHQQRQFVTNVAHELRSPLSLVYGYLQRTPQRIPNLSQVQQESLTMATAEAERMTLILQDLIDLARAESLDISAAQEPIILNGFVRDIANLTEKFDHSNLQTEIVPFPIRVQTHRDYLMQILNHLIQNAIRHSEPDALILIRLTQIDNSAILQVSDCGEGIPRSQQELIFEPFHRVDPSRNRATGGTGLGLAIVKTLVEKLGGTIAVDSTPGIGTVFTLTLPTLGNRV